MRKLIILYLFLLCCTVSSQTQFHSFNVIHRGNLLGTLEASKTTNEGEINYQSHTEIEFNLLIEVPLVYNYNVTFIDGLLKDAKAHITLRGKDKTKVRTVKEDNRYWFYSNEKLKKEIYTPINNSVIQLVLEEPINVRTIYAEEHGDFHNLEKIGEHIYLKIAPNGSESKYYYKNGLLQKSEVDTGIIKFTIVRRE
ncbi:DUF6134 family protein [Algibacter mikhailovii]|uniref:DUF6134 family protein n=1 Tax=Algibacter mikhailovii TaxID=425498 RepID=UPI0016781796|nr:DUF6134 family protein [Algibacter mikhailovii]